MGIRDRWQKIRSRLRRRGDLIRESRPGRLVQNIMDSFSDDWMEQSFRLARERPAPDLEDLPVDFKLRQSSFVRRLYERMLPVSHVMKLGYKHERDYLEDFMPIDQHSYIGRGSYKFVYRLPWRMVIKVSKPILYSDPLLGSLYRQVAAEPEEYLSSDEMNLLEYLKQDSSKRQKEKLDFQFHRLALERYSYWRVREALPGLVLPTRFFMGVRFRRMPMRGFYRMGIRPMDSQIMLVGKHLKEFAVAGHKSEQGKFRRRFFPSYDFEFQSGRFGKIKKKVLVKIAEDFRQLIDFTENLALTEKLILDIHTENLIITLPDFQLKLFDFHLFDEHLYDPTLKADRPEQDHIEVIEKFIESFELEH